MTKPIKDFAASARARLLAVTHARNGNFQLTLQRYVAERFLYRLGESSRREQLVWPAYRSSVRRKVRP